MRRLTIHLKSVPTVEVEGKKKSFNTVVFTLKSKSNPTEIINGFGDNVSKSYISNIK